jgi:hypothetical protein
MALISAMVASPQNVCNEAAVGLKVPMVVVTLSLDSDSQPLTVWVAK